MTSPSPVDPEQAVDEAWRTVHLLAEAIAEAKKLCFGVMDWQRQNRGIARQYIADPSNPEPVKAMFRAVLGWREPLFGEYDRSEPDTTDHHDANCGTERYTNHLDTAAEDAVGMED